MFPNPCRLEPFFKTCVATTPLPSWLRRLPCAGSSLEKTVTKLPKHSHVRWSIRPFLNRHRRLALRRSCRRRRRSDLRGPGPVGLASGDRHVVAVKPGRLDHSCFSVCCVGVVFGRSWPQDPSQRVKLEKRCRTHIKSAPETDYKTISWPIPGQAKN